MNDGPMKRYLDSLRPVQDDQPLGEFPPISVIPSQVIDLAAERLTELEADVQSIQRLYDRQTDRLAVWIGREAAES